MGFKFTLLSIFELASLVTSHGVMFNPPARRYKNNPFATSIDYNLNAPLGHYMYPCKNYREIGKPVRSYRAGGSIRVEIESEGDARHNGGHCEFSLSYDNGNSFVVIKTVIGECLRGLGNNFDVPIPHNAPASNQALFAWTWLNRSGQREFYMNCADIRIENNNGGVLTGPPPVVANMPECVDRARAAPGAEHEKCNLNIGCAYVPEFPHPGQCDGSHHYRNRPNIRVGARGLLRSSLRSSLGTNSTYPILGPNAFMQSDLGFTKKSSSPKDAVSSDSKSTRDLSSSQLDESSSDRLSSKNSQSSIRNNSSVAADGSDLDDQDSFNPSPSNSTRSSSPRTLLDNNRDLIEKDSSSIPSSNLGFDSSPRDL